MNQVIITAALLSNLSLYQFFVCKATPNQQVLWYHTTTKPDVTPEHRSPVTTKHHDPDVTQTTDYWCHTSSSDAASKCL
ncbi:MAG: hypothetical protein O7D30_10705 [Rickettsia endosymbiont of Ixodes persulcatus]|nr:hypothetical protein [Rickettsia endosymbiont of Ixodes persulcatus]